MIAVRIAKGAEFPTAEQLARTDVLLIYTADGGDLNAAQREALAALLKRGGGLVTVLDGVCGHDPKWWKTITGAAWEYGKTKWVYTKSDPPLPRCRASSDERRGGLQARR